MRRRLVALALSTIGHLGLLGLLVLTLGDGRDGAEGPAGPATTGRRFAVAMIDRGAGGRASTALPQDAARARPDAQGKRETISDPARTIMSRAAPPPPAPHSLPRRSEPTVVRDAKPVVEPAVEASTHARVQSADAVAPAAARTAAATTARGEGRATEADPGTGGLAAAPGPRGAAATTGSGSAAAGGADLRPWCRTCPVPDYPARARRRGWQGTVEVDLELNGDGSVGGARVVRTSGFPALDAAAVAVARRSRFRVPEVGGALRGKLRYQFRLERSL